MKKIDILLIILIAFVMMIVFFGLARGQGTFEFVKGQNYSVKWENIDQENNLYNLDREFIVHSWNYSSGWVTNRTVELFMVFPATVNSLYFVTSIYPDRGAVESDPADTVYVNVIDGDIPPPDEPPPTGGTPMPDMARAWTIHNNGQGWISQTEQLNNKICLTGDNEIRKTYELNGGSYLTQISFMGILIRTFGAETDTITSIDPMDVERNQKTYNLDEGTYELVYRNLGDTTSLEYGIHAYNNNNLFDWATASVEELKTPRKALSPRSTWAEEGE